MFNKKSISYICTYLILFNLGVVHKKLNNIDQAISYYERAIELNLKHGYSFLNLAVLYKEMNQYDIALSILNRGIQFNETMSVLYYNRCIFRTL